MDTSDLLSKLTALVRQDRVDSIKANFLQTSRLGETVGEFASKLGAAYEKFAVELRLVVKNFRRKSEELKREKLASVSNFHSTWEAVLAEVEGEATSYGELANGLEQKIAQPLVELLGRKKAQYKRIFAYREPMEEVISRADEGVQKTHKEYADAWSRYKAQDRDTLKDNDVLRCHNAHNAYVLALAHSNELAFHYYRHALPNLLKDLTEIRLFIADGMSRNLLLHVSLMKRKHERALANWDAFHQAVDSGIKSEVDLESFVLSVKIHPSSLEPSKKSFQGPEVNALGGFLKNELVLDLLTEAALVQQLSSFKLESAILSDKISKQEKELASLQALHTRYSENQDFGDPLVVQEDIYKLSQDLRLVHLQDSGLLAKLQMFKSLESELQDEVNPLDFRRSSAASPKPFRAGSSPSFQLHAFDWRNYKRPTHCSYCKGLLKGLFKQGVRCKICKINVHEKCKEKVQSCKGGTLSKKSRGRGGSLSSASSLTSSISEDKEDIYINVSSGDQTPPERRETLQRLRTVRKSKRGQEAESGQRPGSSLSPPCTDTKTENSAEGVYCVVMFDYDGENLHDLTVKAGTKLLLLDSTDSSWWKFLCNGNYGFVPANYVQEIKPTEKIARTLYTFTAEEEDELGFAADQIVVVISTESDGWLIGKIGDQAGVFPEGYVAILD